MIFKSFFIILAGLFIAQIATSANELPPIPLPTCVSNKKDYLARSSEMPEILRGIDRKPHGQMYRLAGLKRLAANAAIKIRFADNNKFLFDAGVYAPGKLFLVEERYISKICFEDRDVKIILEDGTTYNAQMNESDSFDLEGGNFKATTEADFAKEIDSIRKQMNRKPPVEEPNSAEKLKNLNIQYKGNK